MTFSGTLPINVLSQIASPEVHRVVQIEIRIYWVNTSQMSIIDNGGHPMFFIISTMPTCSTQCCFTSVYL